MSVTSIVVPAGSAIQRFFAAPSLHSSQPGRYSRTPVAMVPAWSA
jgi:hypothetical protein